MKASKLLLFATSLVLLAGLEASALAQVKMESPSSLPGPIGTVTRVSAIEVTDGTVGFDGQTKQETAFGYSFLGQTTGVFPGSFTLSMNCSPAKPNAVVNSELTGGAWTLPVYKTSGLKASNYVGSLYGTVAKGEMSWDKTATSANVYIVLNVDGGTDAWSNVKGYATFVGTLFVDEKTNKTTLAGDLVFSILSPAVE